MIDLRPERALRAPPYPSLYCCARCGADLWNILADGRVRCAYCEQECAMRAVQLNPCEYEMKNGDRNVISTQIKIEKVLHVAHHGLMSTRTILTPDF